MTTKMLTKQNCPKCEQLKTMLAKPLKGQFEVELVPFEDKPDEFNALALKHSVVSLPALIRGDKALLDCSQLGAVKKFLS